MTSLPVLSHFETVQTGKVVEDAGRFVIFRILKAIGKRPFGGFDKNISMGLASRAQKNSACTRTPNRSSSRIPA